MVAFFTETLPIYLFNDANLNILTIIVSILFMILSIVMRWIRKNYLNHSIRGWRKEFLVTNGLSGATLFTTFLLMYAILLGIEKIEIIQKHSVLIFYSVLGSFVTALSNWWLAMNKD